MRNSFFDHYRSELFSKDEPIHLRKSLVEILGTGRVLIENHIGILQYTKEKILVRLNCGSVGIFGHNMRIALMTKWQLVICGEVTGVMLNKEEQK